MSEKLLFVKFARHASFHFDTALVVGVQNLPQSNLWLIANYWVFFFFFFWRFAKRELDYKIFSNAYYL